jgi:serine/threonine protein kinase
MANEYRADGDVHGEERSHAPTAPLSTTPLQAGDVALLNGRYRIERELGRGGIGVVHLARDQQMESRQVVIKTLLTQRADEKWFRKKFNDEMRALVRLNHPSVVGALDAGVQADGQPFLVMEYIAGETLRARMKAGEIPLTDVVDIVRQTGRALTAAHDRGIYHRDLKPENIMLQDLGHGQRLVKIIDFGIATVKEATDSSRDSTHVAGTPTYMAPEQFDGKPEAASDTYALALIAYELLAGTTPFTGRSLSQLIDLKRKPLPMALARFKAVVPQSCRDLIVQGLSPQPNLRPRSAGDFGEAFALALAGPSGPTTPRVAPARQRLWPVGAAWLLAAGAVALLAIGVPTLGRHWRPAATTPAGLAAAPAPSSGGGPSGAKEPGRSGAAGKTPAPGSSEPGAASRATATSVVPSPRDASGASPASRQTHQRAVQQRDTSAVAHPPPATAASLATVADRAPSQGPEGELLIAARPWANVIVDGVSVGMTPMEPLSLSVGRHEVVLEHPSFPRVTRSVVVRPNSTEKLVVDLQHDGVRASDKEH